nr:RNA-directed DNA polymerase, eukaryota, reverse transcriptase zinc-binding domain protein [Tanacetum cinerariifolium]
MSATEAEYIVAPEATMEAVWIRKFISGLGIVPTIKELIKMFCDNSAALLIANEPGVQRGARHYHKRYHYVRECIKLGEINLLKVHTDENLVDHLRKLYQKESLLNMLGAWDFRDLPLDLGWLLCGIRFIHTRIFKTVFTLIAKSWNPIREWRLRMKLILSRNFPHSPPKRASLNDVPLGGYKFTWTNKWGSKMSKIDRFLVSDMFYETFPTTSGVILQKGIPNHRPILMKEMNDGIVDANSLISFKKKLQNLKGVIRLWAALQRATSSSIKKEHLLRLSSIDIKIDQGLVSDMDLCDRREDEIKRAVWDCGGDRAPSPDGFTFKFFTTFWDLIEPDVCRFVLDFFSTGAFPKGYNSSFIALIPKVSNATLVTDLRPISLIGCQYKIIGKLLLNRLSCVIDSCISPEQSAFIKNHNILDGPLILSEMMAWHRKNKKQLMVFKVDFKKAFDSLKWDYLDLVMVKFGFGCKWRAWIKGCLRDARSSVLVNGFPSKEFKIFRGLRQGDPLSPFLFILAMEGLHAIIFKAANLGIFKCTSLGTNNLCILHLMYADDVIFMGECKKMGGLGIGSIFALIVRLLFKWVWRFFCNPPYLWIKVIKEFYRPHGGIYSDNLHYSSQSPWAGILSSIKAIKAKGIDLLSLCVRKLGNRAFIQFWNDVWLGDTTLKLLFPRVFFSKPTDYVPLQTVWVLLIGLWFLEGLLGGAHKCLSYMACVPSLLMWIFQIMGTHGLGLPLLVKVFLLLRYVLIWIFAFLILPHRPLVGTGLCQLKSCFLMEDGVKQASY